MMAAFGLAAMAGGKLGARKPPPVEAGAAAQAENQPFQLRVERNVVQVRVVVHDSRGKVVPGLTRSDFLLFDDGKRQVITGFSVRGGVLPAIPGSTAPAALAPPKAPAPVIIPDHFVALYYDDLWMPFSNVVHTREAAERYLKTQLQPDDRIGLFTSSGIGQVDFTDDRDKLDQALMKLRPRSSEPPAGVACPDLSDYEAYLIDQLNEPTATRVATEQVIECQCHGDAQICTDAADVAKMAARARWEEVDYDVSNSLRGLEQLVERLATMPGQRAILFISPGFMELSELSELTAVIDRAVRESVVINALDSRGLWARMPGGDVSEPTASISPQFLAALDQIKEAAYERESDVLGELADGTGGIFFHNNNDYDAGFREAGGLPQLSYVLEFSPSDLKDNGQYHRLKVKLTGPVAHWHGLKLEARKGYFAPKHAQDAGQVEAEEIHDAVFSRSDSQELSLQVTPSVKKLGGGKNMLTVTMHLAAQGLAMAKHGDRYVDQFTVVTAIFDHNGRYETRSEKKVNLHLQELDWVKMLEHGLNIQVGFVLAPGDYLVRDVVRDSSGALATVNNALRIES